MAELFHAMNGEILALASRPCSMTPEPKTNGMDSSFLSIPMEQYPFGSVFKIIVAAAALIAAGIRKVLFTCTGGIQAGNAGCLVMPIQAAWEPLRFGKHLLTCNDTFIQLPRSCGETIIEMAKRFGLGEEINIELPNIQG